MITLHVDLKTSSEEERHILVKQFNKMVDLEKFLMFEVNQWDKKVYIFAYEEAENEAGGVVFVDHSYANIIDHSSTHLRHFYEGGKEEKDMGVFLFACSDYNEAYEMALNMKEPTGLLKWQLMEDTIEATIANRGIEFVLSTN
jgi:hypothetical protein